jgi:hypothetical protein
MRFIDALREVLNQAAAGKPPDPVYMQELEKASKIIDLVSGWVTLDGALSVKRLRSFAGKVSLGDEGIVAGGGYVTIDENGITFLYGSEDANIMKWVDENGDVVGRIYIDENGNILISSDSSMVFTGDTAAFDTGGLFVRGTASLPYPRLLMQEIDADQVYTDGYATLYYYVNGSVMELRARLKDGATEKQLTLGKYSLVFGSHAQGATVAARPGGVGTFTTAFLSLFNVGFVTTLAANPLRLSGKLKNLSVRGTSGAQPASGNMTVTINVGGSATALALTIPAGSTTTAFENTTDVIDYTAGDLIRVDYANFASAASKPMGMATFELEPSF